MHTTSHEDGWLVHVPILGLDGEEGVPLLVHALQSPVLEDLQVLISLEGLELGEHVVLVQAMDLSVSAPGCYLGLPPGPVRWSRFGVWFCVCDHHDL